MEIKCDVDTDSAVNVSMSMSLAIHLHRYRNLVCSQDGCFIYRVSCDMSCTIA